MGIVDKVTLNQTDQNKWFKNLLLFLAPVAVVYVVALIGVINAHNGAFTLNDLIPTPFTYGAGMLYVLNSLLDYLRKLQS